MNSAEPFAASQLWICTKMQLALLMFASSQQRSLQKIQEVVPTLMSTTWSEAGQKRSCCSHAM